MAVPGDLEHLLRQIRAVRSPVRRARLLAQAWKRLRSLTPAERQESISRLGVDKFRGLLGRFGNKEDGPLAEEILEALDHAEDLDPSKVGAFIRDLRDPARRKDLARKGLVALGERLAREEPAEGAEPDANAMSAAAGPPPGTVDREPPSPPTVEAAAQSGAGPEISGVAALSAVPALVPPGAPEMGEISEESAGEGLDTEDGSIHEPPGSPEAGDSDGQIGAAAASWQPTPARPRTTFTPIPMPSIEAGEASPERPGALPAHGHDGEREHLLRSLRVPVSMTSRFRAIRRFLSSGESLPVGEIRAVLESFPEGWPRRRALAALLREGIPELLADALALVAELGRASDRRWCASVLLHTWDLDEAEVQAIHEIL